MSGFFTLQRAAFDHPLLNRDVARLGAWTWLVGRACWKATRFDVSGKTIELERGQLCVSIRQMAAAWGWSKSAVDRFITRLKTETMIETEAGHGRLVITICNYAKYQDMENHDRDSNRDATGTAAGQQRDIKEQGNKGTTEKEERETGDFAKKCDGKKPGKITPEMEQIVEVWNAVALPLGLSRCFTISDKRAGALRARLKQHGFDNMKRAILAVPRSSFLRGNSGDWQGASIDFILKPDSTLKILEGAYDDKPNRTSGKRDGFLKAIDDELGIGAG